MSSTLSKRILCIWFPNWAIQRLVVSVPELRRQSIALFRRDARRGQIVSAASPLARQHGVTVNMPLSEAKSLLRRSTATKGTDEAPAFYVFEHDPQADLEELEQVCERMESFSPIAGLETISQRGQQPCCLLLDVTGLAHLFGDESQLARELMLDLESIGYFPRVAIANTVGAAWAAARCLAGNYFRQHEQPLVIAPDDQETLDQLPVESLRLEDSIVDTLYQLGIKRLDQLQRLSRNDLAMRFGNYIHQRIDQLSGVIEEPVVAKRKPTEFISEQLLEYPTRHRETLEVIIQRAVADLCEQMRGRQQGALEWTIRFICNVDPIEFHVNLFQPTATVEHIMPLVEMQLEQVFNGNVQRRFTNPHAPKKKRRLTTFEVNEVIVMVSSHVLLAQQQRQLFDENPRLDRQALSHLINRLASRLGPQNVVYPTLQSGAQPEYSYRFKPLVDARRKRRRQTARSSSKSHLLGRPARLLQPPRRIEAGLQVADTALPADARLAVRAATRPPTRLTFDSQRTYQVRHAWGPERIETGWWRGRTVCRDYWRIAVETNQHFWIYRDLRSGRWWLHGEF